MKKVFACMLALTMLLSCAALADQNENGEFVFRGGVQWGMTRDGVMSREGIDASSDSVTEYKLPARLMDVAAVQISGVSAAGVQAELTYIFADGLLVGAEYVFDSAVITLEQLRLSLHELYGNSLILNRTRLEEALSGLTESDEAAEEQLQRIISGCNSAWECPATYIVLMTREDESAYMILYLGEDVLAAQIRASKINTDGL